MVSTFDIIGHTVKMLRPVLGPMITGKVYAHHEPENDQKENITVGTINNPGTYLQSGIMNVNFSVMDITKGMANLARMKCIMEALYPIFDDKVVSSADQNVPTLHFSIDDDKGIFRDQSNDGKSFYNLRINFVTL